ncbi:MAG: alpha/beta fold hydrolase [Anaerolineae bacterium]|jgi:N-formylmaleamate deformylase|nr:alpha/beta hydrolase [Chloroflexota bacterium]
MSQNWTEGDVLTNGIRMHYYRTGGDKPALVLAHGFSDNGLCWTPVARVLQADYDVIMIDARNHGKSEAPAGPGGSRAQGDDLAGLIVALKLDKPAVMGHSMGGGATLNAVANHPGLIRRAILEDSGPNDPRPAPTPEQRRQRTGWAEELQTKTREEIMEIGRKQSPLWSEEELGPWADSKLQLNIKAAAQIGTPGEPWREIFARVTCPMLILRSDNDRGSGVTPENAAEAERLFPLVRSVYIPGAGHNIRRENFPDFMAAVTAFLKED